MMQTLITFTFTKRWFQCNIAHVTQIYYNYDSIDSGCQTVYIITGDNEFRNLSVVTPGRLCWPV